MKSIFISVILISVFAAAARAEIYDPRPREPKDFRVPGTNLGEKQISLAWFHLPTFLAACLYSDQCSFTVEQKKLLWPWLEKFDRSTHGALEFVSERKRPDLFKSAQGERHRLAITGDKIGATIYLNTDLLPPEPRPLQIAKWMGILAHEVMHHLGHKDDEKRLPDTIASTVALAAEKFLSRWDVTGTNGALQLWLLNVPTPKTKNSLERFPQGLHPRLFLVDGEKIFSSHVMHHSWNMKRACLEGETFLSAHGSPFNELLGKANSDGKRNLTLTYETQVACLSKEQDRIIGRKFDVLAFLQFTQRNAKPVIAPPSLIFGKADQDEQAGTESRVKVVDVYLPQQQVTPGTTFSFEAKIKDLGMELPAKGCGAAFSRPFWPVFPFSQPYQFYHSRCTILAQQDGVYSIRLEIDFPLKSQAGEVSIERVCLSPSSKPDEGCYTASLAKRKVFEVKGAVQPELKIAKSEILHAKPLKASAAYRHYYHIAKGDYFTLAIEVAGGTAPIDAFFEGSLVDTQDRLYAFSGPLLAPTAYLIKAKRFSPTPTGFRIEFDFELPQIFETETIKTIKLDNISFISRELQVARLDFASNEFAVAFTEYVPGASR